MKGLATYLGDYNAPYMTIMAFIYICYILLGSYSFILLCNELFKNKKVLYVILGIFLTFNIGMVLIYGINNTAYFNLLISHKNIENRYELDYYGVLLKDY